MTCRLVNTHRRLRGPCCLHPQPLLGLLILKTVSASSIETTVRVFANCHGVTTRKTCILTLRTVNSWFNVFPSPGERLFKCTDQINRSEDYSKISRRHKGASDRRVE